MRVQEWRVNADFHSLSRYLLKLEVRHHVVTPICLLFRCVAIHKLLEHNSLGDDSEHSDDVTYAIGWGDHDSSRAPFPGPFAPSASAEAELCE
jgi:hypothetical protein